MGAVDSVVAGAASVAVGVSVDAVGGSRVAGDVAGDASVDVLDSLLRASMSSQMFASLPLIA